MVLSDERRRAAERFLPGAVRARLRNPQVRPHWIGDSDRFWFRRETGAGVAFTVVDAATGAQAAAFDHEAVARAVAVATGEPAEPAALPLADIDLAGPDLRVCLADGSWLTVGTGQRDAGPLLRAGEAANADRTLAAFRRDHDLWLRDLRTGVERRVTADGLPHHAYAKSPDMNLTAVSLRRRGIALPANVLWSPDGRLAFTSRLDEREVLDLPLVEDVPGDGGVRPVLHLMKYAMSGDAVLPMEAFCVVHAETGHADTGRVVEAAMPPAVAGVTTVVEDEKAWWSPDSRHVFFVTRDRLWQRFTLHEMDAETGAVRDVHTETASTFLDSNVSVLGLPNIRVLPRSGTFLWFSQKSGWGHLYRHDLVTGACLNAVTSGAWLVRDLLHVDEEAGTVEFLAAGLVPGANPYHRTLCRAGLDGTGLVVLTPGVDDHALAMPVKRAPRDHIRPAPEEGAWRAPSGRFFVHTHSDLTTLPVSELRRADGSLVSVLAQAEFDGAWRPPTPFTVLADDGATELWGALWLPTDFDPARRYPVIDYIYPGPQRGMTPAVAFTDFMPELFRSSIPQAFAELGFAVLNVDGRGTPLRSKALQDHSYGRLHDPGTLADHVATLRQLGERHGFLDLSRVGIMGHSGGGYASVRALLDHPDVFHAAVATSGNHDQMGYSYAWTEKYQGAVVRHADGTTSYGRAANAPDAARLRGALLLAHGGVDDNVHPALTSQLVAALIAADRDFEFVPLPGDDHTTVWGNRYFLRRAMAFLVRHLRAG